LIGRGGEMKQMRTIGREIMQKMSLMVGVAMVASMFAATACAPKQEVVCTMPPLVGYIVEKNQNHPK
jgi:hypothetical protein